MSSVLFGPEYQCSAWWSIGEFNRDDKGKLLVEARYALFSESYTVEFAYVIVNNFWSKQNGSQLQTSFHTHCFYISERIVQNDMFMASI